MTTLKPCEQIVEYCTYSQFYFDENFSGLNCDMEEEKEYIDIELAKEEALVIANIISCTCNSDYKDDDAYYGWYDNDERIALHASTDILEYIYENI